MTNKWIEHVRKYAKDNNISYACALSTPECKNTYIKPLSKSKKKTNCKTDCKTCKTCKINKEPHKMYDKPIGPMKPKEIHKMYGKPIGPKKPKEIHKMYDKPIGPKKLNKNIIKNEELISDIEKTLNSKSTRNIRTLKKKYSVIFKDELLNNLFDGQQYNDFFPTSQNCLELFNDSLKNIEKDEHILEPSAGIGSIVHYLQKQGYNNIEANDFDKTMTEFIKEHYNNVKVTNADFLNKNYDNNDFSVIFCNPPFTFGNNKTFYIDFLFKCCDVLRKSKVKFEKNIFFISPPLIKSIKKNEVVSHYDMFNNLSKVKQKELLKKYDIESEDDLEFFLPNQTVKIGTCSNFAGTKFTGDLYHMLLI